MRTGKSQVFQLVPLVRLAPLGAILVGSACGCEDAPGSAPPGADAPRGARAVSTAAGAASVATVTAAADPPRAPDIVVDASRVSIGADRVPTGELGLTDRVAVFLTGRPAVEGMAVSFVAMRNAKPSTVAAVVGALRKAKASGAIVKSDARDGSTQSVPLSFRTDLADCTTVAHIGKDAAIEVWPAGGGTPRRVTKGLAGPDMTLGTEAMGKQWSTCSAAEIVVGASDVLTWGLVFDLARSAFEASGTRVSTAVLDDGAVPGRKIELP
jgi:hypothetical protein